MAADVFSLADIDKAIKIAAGLSPTVAAKVATPPKVNPGAYIP